MLKEHLHLVILGVNIYIKYTNMKSKYTVIKTIGINQMQGKKIKQKN